MSAPDSSDGPMPTKLPYAPIRMDDSVSSPSGRYHQDSRHRLTGNVLLSVVAFIACFAASTLVVSFLRSLWRPNVSSLGHPFPVTRSNPSLTIMFLIREEFMFPKVWDAWMKDANNWIASPSGGQAELHLTAHHRRGLHTAAVKKTMPASIADAIVFAPPAICAWGHTSPCMHRLLSTSLEAHPSADFFAFVSQDAVPLQRFADIVQALKDNPRSRFPITDFHFSDTPKHHQWIVLRRNHAQLLADHPDVWTNRTTCAGTCRRPDHGCAADDERCPLRALEMLFTPNHASPELQANTTSTATSSSHLRPTPPTPTATPPSLTAVSAQSASDFPYRLQLWKEINSGRYPPDLGSGPRSIGSKEDEVRTFACWLRWQRCHRFGTCQKAKDPCMWTSLKSENFQAQVLDVGYHWFGRKFAEDCVVVSLGSKVEALEDWLIERVIKRKQPD